MLYVNTVVFHWNTADRIGVARGGAWGPRPHKGSGKTCTTVLAVQKE